MKDGTQQQLPFGKASPGLTSETQFPSTDSWKKRAIDCLILNQKLMTTIEILNCLIGAAFTRLNKEERSVSVTNLSVTLSNLTKEGYVKKLKITGLKGNYYGLSNWFEKDGRIKKDYATNSLQAFLDNTNQQPHGCCD